MMTRRWRRQAKVERRVAALEVRQRLVEAAVVELVVGIRELTGVVEQVGTALRRLIEAGTDVSDVTLDLIGTVSAGLEELVEAGAGGEAGVEARERMARRLILLAAQYTVVVEARQITYEDKDEARTEKGE